MPGSDGTGPSQRGPMTGRGLGHCIVEIPSGISAEDWLQQHGLAGTTRPLRSHRNTHPGKFPRRLCALVGLGLRIRQHGNR